MPTDHELSALDAWANEVRDGILEQVHMALDAYERASQRHTASLLLHEASQWTDAIDRAVAQCRSDLFVAVESLQAEVRSLPSHVLRSPRGSGGVAESRLEQNEARLEALEAVPRPLEERIAALEAATSHRSHGRDWSPRAALPQPPELLEDPTSAVSLSDCLGKRLATVEEEPAEDVASTVSLSDRLGRRLATLEDGILGLRREHAMLETRTEAHGVSGAVFALRVWDMDEYGRAKSLEALEEREAELKRLLDEAQEVNGWGGMGELLAKFGVRYTKAPAAGGAESLGSVLDEATIIVVRV